ncbi:MAG: thioredoxin family protein [bacterium]|jgi:thiol-disulfide isomerase/thioredoxin|nr:thioredoxin family protein [Betaproteobacteria bacterium]
MIRRTVNTLLAGALLGLSSLANAIDLRPFDASALAGLQSAGKPVAVHFHANWCPTCVSQTRAFDQMKSAGQLQGLTVLVADYDKETELRRTLKVRSQSTLVVYRGKDEVARSAGQTDPEALRKALAAAL